jgi:hypothetical protein
MEVYLNSPTRQSLFCDEKPLARYLEFLESELIRLRATWRQQIGYELALRNYRVFRLTGEDRFRFEAWRLLHLALESVAELERSRS